MKDKELIHRITGNREREREIERVKKGVRETELREM
jgi:hypothetical protein